MFKEELNIYIYCDLQIRPVEEHLKQRVIDEPYCISRKRKSYKRSTSRSQFALCLCKKREVIILEPASSENMFRLDESIFGV